MKKKEKYLVDLIRSGYLKRKSSYFEVHEDNEVCRPYYCLCNIVCMTNGEKNLTVLSGILVVL